MRVVVDMKIQPNNTFVGLDFEMDLFPITIVPAHPISKEKVGPTIFDLSISTRFELFGVCVPPRDATFRCRDRAVGLFSLEPTD